MRSAPCLVAQYGADPIKIRPRTSKPHAHKISSEPLHFARMVCSQPVFIVRSIHTCSRVYAKEFFARLFFLPAETPRSRRTCFSCGLPRSLPRGSSPAWPCAQNAERREETRSSATQCRAQRNTQPNTSSKRREKKITRKRHGMEVSRKTLQSQTASHSRRLALPSWSTLSFSLSLSHHVWIFQLEQLGAFFLCRTTRGR